MKAPTVKHVLRRSWRTFGPTGATLGLLIAWATSVYSGEMQSSSARAVPAPSLEGRLAGYWQDDADPSYLVGFEGSLMTTALAGQVRRVARVLGSEGSRLHLCDHGWRSARDVTFGSQGDLVLHDPDDDETRRLRRLGAKPPALVLSPAPVAEPTAISAEKTSEVQRELWDRSFPKGRPAPRVATETGPAWIWQTPPRRPKVEWSLERFRAIDQRSRDNAYLKALLAEVGWIDVERFGYPTAGNAFLLVQHSGDLPLMLAALPWIKKDVDAGRTEGEDYALLYDRLHLSLEGRQRYGSQVGFDNANQAVVLPLEEPDRIHELRQALGMEPLAQYVEAVAKFNHAFMPDKLTLTSECIPPTDLDHGR